MARNVSEHEIDALLARGEEGPAPAPVLPRDFREPRRLSAEDLEALRRPAQAAAEAALEALRVDLPGEVLLEPVEIAETSLDLVLRTGESEVVASITEGPAGPCIALLDLGSAVLVAETALGTEGGEATVARALTALESLLVARLLGRVLERTAHTMQLPAKDARFVAGRGALARELAPDGDPRRIALRIPFTATGSRIVIHVMLAGVKAPARRQKTGTTPAKDSKSPTLPAGIAPTNVELCAVLARSEILLTELLALEPGDVIELDAAPGLPIDVEIEGRVRARARFGSRDGRLAVRIQELHRDPDPR